MNEIASFCNDDGKGQVCANTASQGCPAPGASQTSCCLVCKTVDSTNKLDFPPYNIANNKGLLSAKTLAMSATHYGNITVYDAHNLYGLTEQIATAGALTDIRGKRPFVLSRSGFLSTGVHSAKWTGDNQASWDDLKASIIGVMDFNLFGVPMIGADICGFIGDSNEELCARWIEVGAFYPFSRDHNTLGAAPQELYVWPTVAEASRNALGLRYQLLPYMYTAFADAHFNGATVARALWMNFPTDPLCASIDRQFMLGDGVLLSPVLDSGATTVSAYFPQGYWYSLFTKQLSVDASTGGKTVSLATSLTQTNAHVLGGAIVPMQGSALTTTASRATPFSLLVALSPAGTASGSLFWDDGEQIELTEYLSVSYSAVYARDSLGVYAGSVTVTVTQNSFPSASSFTLNSIQVLGVGLSAPHSPEVTVVGGGSTAVTDVVVGADGGSLTFNSLKLGLDESFVLHF